LSSLPPSGPTEIDRMADPPTPPHTPASSSKGTSNVNQGNVNNGGIRNNGGVVTGNVAGFNTIVGNL
jgi:hypothetical protein